MTLTRALGTVVSMVVLGCASSHGTGAPASQPPPPPANNTAAMQPAQPAPVQASATAVQPAEPPAMLDCSNVPGRPTDLPANLKERYYPRAMKNSLDRDTVLKQRYGKDQVMNCADARQFMAIYKQEEERMMGARVFHREPGAQPAQQQQAPQQAQTEPLNAP